jgi:hypothetical protein
MAVTSENTSGFKAFTATAVAIGIGVRVKVDSSGLISAADASEAWVGTTVSAIAASGTGTVRLRNSPGTHLFVCSGAVAVGGRLYPTDSGKVDDAAGTGCFTGFTALKAGSADGDIIEGAPCDDVTWTSAAAQAAAPAGGTGATAGAYDTANNRDAMIALVNAMRTALINAGIMKGS